MRQCSLGAVAHQKHNVGVPHVGEHLHLGSILPGALQPPHSRRFTATRHPISLPLNTCIAPAGRGARNKRG